MLGRLLLLVGLMGLVLLVGYLMWRPNELSPGCGARKLAGLHTVDHRLRLLLRLGLSAHCHDVAHVVMLGRHMIDKHARVGATLAKLAGDALRKRDTGLILLGKLHPHVHLRATLWVGRGLGGNATHLRIDTGGEHALLHLCRGISHH